MCVYVNCEIKLQKFLVTFYHILNINFLLQYREELLCMHYTFLYNIFKIYICIYCIICDIFFILSFFLQSNSIDRSICHNGIQYDNRWYADLWYNLHNRALRILAVVLLSLQGIPRREIISLSFLSFDLDGVISDNPRRL